MNIIEVFEASSTLAVGDGSVGIVEKVIIGANATVQYQLISYSPERHSVLVSEFEVTPVEGKVTKQQIGFAIVAKPEQKEVTILVDEQNNFVGVNSAEEILVKTLTLDEDQLNEHLGVNNEKEKEKEE